MNERLASPATSFPSHGSNTDMAPFTRIGRGSKGYLNPGCPTFFWDIPYTCRTGNPQKEEGHPGFR